MKKPIKIKNTANNHIHYRGDAETRRKAFIAKDFCSVLLEPQSLLSDLGELGGLKLFVLLCRCLNPESFTWRTSRLGGSKLFVLPFGVALTNKIAFSAIPRFRGEICLPCSSLNAFPGEGRP